MWAFNEKNGWKVWCVMKKQYLCIVKNGTGGSVERLDYGVMVTQQILVLFFQVRVLVVQLKSDRFLSLFLLLHIDMWNKKVKHKVSPFYIYSLIDSSMTAIFCVINSKSAFSFSILRFISETKLFPFLEELVKKPMLFSYVLISFFIFS